MFIKYAVSAIASSALLIGCAEFSSLAIKKFKFDYMGRERTATCELLDKKQLVIGAGKTAQAIVCSTRHRGTHVTCLSQSSNIETKESYRQRFNRLTQNEVAVGCLNAIEKIEKDRRSGNGSNYSPPT